MRLNNSLTPNDVLFSGIEALHPEVPRLRKIVDGWTNRSGISGGEVIELALRCPNPEIIRRIILAETVRWPEQPFAFLNDAARAFREPKREGWMRETTAEYPLGAILGLLQSVTWHINRHAEVILWKRQEKLRETGLLEAMPNWFGWILSGTQKPDHWIRQITDPILPDHPKWSGELANTFGEWRQAMRKHDSTIHIGDLMKVYVDLFGEFPKDHLAALTFGHFGTSVLCNLNYSLFGELKETFQAHLLWEGFVSKH